MAPADAVQVRVGVRETLAAPLAGAVSAGAAICVVNDQVAEAVEPLPFLAETCQ